MSKQRPSRLPLWQEQTVYWSFGLLVASGIGWLLFDQWIRVPGEFGIERHPAQHWVLIAHGVAAYAVLIVAGALIPVHIRLGWNIGRNRNSGILLTGSCLLLALTALGLYYIGSEIARHWTSIVHWTVGLAAMLALVFHVVMGRQG